MPITTYSKINNSSDLPTIIVELLTEIDKFEPNVISVGKCTIFRKFFKNKELYCLYAFDKKTSESQIIIAGGCEKETICAWLYGYLNGLEKDTRLILNLRKL